MVHVFLLSIPTGELGYNRPWPILKINGAFMATVVPSDSKFGGVPSKSMA